MAIEKQKPYTQEQNSKELFVSIKPINPGALSPVISKKRKQTVWLIHNTKPNYINFKFKNSLCFD